MAKLQQRVVMDMISSSVWCPAGALLSLTSAGSPPWETVAPATQAANCLKKIVVQDCGTKFR